MNKLMVRAVFVLAALLLRYPAPAAADTFEVLNIPSIGAIDVNSFSLSGNEFTLARDVDIFSPKILLAVTNGTIFAKATFELFDTSISSTVPFLTYDLHNAIFVNVTISSGGDRPTETDLLEAESITRETSPTPEPATVSLVGVGLLVALRRRLKTS